MAAKNRVDTIQGKLRFDGASNYGDDLMVVKQVRTAAGSPSGRRVPRRPAPR
jgi:hypothetical protein